jgi:hypothetical protein
MSQSDGLTNPEAMDFASGSTHHSQYVCQGVAGFGDAGEKNLPLKHLAEFIEKAE